MDLTIIIPAYNCQVELDNSLRRLERNDNIEIIVVDDGSAKPIHADNVRLIRHSRNLGVGAAFDTGVKAATTENIVLMGADIIPQEGWYDEAVTILENHPMAITCAKCSGWSKNTQPFREKRNIQYGAFILPTHEKRWGTNTIPDIIQAKWKPGPPAWEGDVGRISCILGAFYLTTKTLYNNIGGWMGHKHWGGLEPMISLRAKRSGYPLFVAKDLEAAHHFGRTTLGERAPNWPVYFYNKIMMAETMFEDPESAWKFLYSRGGNNWVRKGHDMVKKAMRTGEIQDIREYHKQNWINGLIKNNEEL